MGGTANWAVDLETANEPPGDVASWSQFVLAVSMGLNPSLELSLDPSSLTGNWTKLTCTDPAVVDAVTMTPAERWAELDGIDAWNDVISVWTNVDRPAGGIYLSESISDSINGPEDSNCGVLGATSNCDSILVCKDVEGMTGSGPAAYELWNSLVYVHEMHETVHDTIIQAAALYLDPTYDLFEDTFAPVPPPSITWSTVLTGLIAFGVSMVISSAFTNIISEVPYFVEEAAEGSTVAYDNLRNVGASLQSFITGITPLYIKANIGSWTTTSQATMSAYLGLAVDHWANLTEVHLSTMFSGTDDSIKVLSALISAGEMVEGKGGSPQMGVSSSTTTQIEKSIMLAYYSMAIPAVWGVSALNAFVLDSGADCSDTSVVDDYIDTPTQNITKGCIDDHLYFLVYPKGDAKQYCNSDDCEEDQHFRFPVGADSLDGTRWGGITVTDLINGSVRSYRANGNANGGPAADITNLDTLTDLTNHDITTPGYINFPVCSGEWAFNIWLKYSDRTLPQWPCYIPPPKSDCQSSSFIDQTSDASPDINDCMHIVSNIVGTNGEWTTQVVGERQRELVSYGSCKFGVQATDEHGNVNFKVAAQDIVDIITEAVGQFGGSGKVGAKGYMDCSGNINSQDIEWGIS